MPDKASLNLVLSANSTDISRVRLAGVQKPFEELTISELVQLKAAGQASDSTSINITAVGTDATISTSSLLAKIGQAAASQAMHTTIAQQQTLQTTHLSNVARGTSSVAAATRVSGVEISPEVGK